VGPNSFKSCSKFFFTSESVTEGHPDKICDRVADGILDAILEQDPKGHVAGECLVTADLLHLAGEISAKASIDPVGIARHIIKDLGYIESEYGFTHNCKIINSIKEQSADIALGIEKSGHELGAGDQGMVIGFAVSETPEYMPLPIKLAHSLTRRLTEVRKSKELPFLRPDGKSQVTLEYHKGKPVRVNTIIVSAQHNPDIEIDKLRHEIKDRVICHSIPKNLLDDKTIIHINPTDRFVIGGPLGDTGVTGRKIIVDTYGGMARHGGGCFSGKDATKVDRSGAYMARYAAKNLVASGFADKLEIQVAYCIGKGQSVAMMVETFGTGKVSDREITRILKSKFDFRPAAIIEKLELNRPIFGRTTNYGHFGREDEGLAWEKVDLSL
jgi:S-adenosylmethionine synthetase